MCSWLSELLSSSSADEWNRNKIRSGTERFQLNSVRKRQWQVGRTQAILIMQWKQLPPLQVSMKGIIDLIPLSLWLRLHKLQLRLKETHTPNRRMTNSVDGLYVSVYKWIEICAWALLRVRFSEQTKPVKSQCYVCECTLYSKGRARM